MLIGERARGRATAERVAFRRPLAVIAALEIGKDDGRPRLLSLLRNWFRAADDGGEARLSQGFILPLDLAGQLLGAH